jgi:hypothetical protein
MANLVPLLSVPSQNVKTVLNNQIVELSVYQLRYGLFIDVSVSGTLLIGGVICQNLNRIIRSVYLNAQAGFAGDFVFNDTQGTSDPTFDGLGTRYQLLYLSQDDLATLGFAA